MSKEILPQAVPVLSVSALLRSVRDALEKNPPPLHQNRRPKIYYATQVGTEPPTVVMFCNDPKAFDEPYRRYLLGALRDHLPFAEVPIKPEPVPVQDATVGGPRDVEALGDAFPCRWR